MGIITNIISRINKEKEEKRGRKIPNEFQQRTNRPNTGIWY